MASKNEYNAKSITVLEGLEAVRKRPGMYIGDTGPTGLHHLVWEVVDNSVDEAMAGYADTVKVILRADGGVEVIDNGRGIPVEMHEQQKKPTVEVVMTILHAGGKFDSESYAVSGGLHGVGISVVNALSTRLDVEIHRGGSSYAQTYSKSKPGPLTTTGRSNKTGTTIVFWPDDTIFETVEFSFDTITRRLQQMAFLNKGLTIITEERSGHEGRQHPRRPPRGRSTTPAAWSTTSGTSTPPRTRRTPRSSVSSRRPKRWRWRSRCSGTPPTTSRCTPSPTPSTLSTAEPTKRASARR